MNPPRLVIPVPHASYLLDHAQEKPCIKQKNTLGIISKRATFLKSLLYRQTNNAFKYWLYNNYSRSQTIYGSLVETLGHIPEIIRKT